MCVDGILDMKDFRAGSWFTHGLSWDSQNSDESAERERKLLEVT